MKIERAIVGATAVAAVAAVPPPMEQAREAAPPQVALARDAAPLAWHDDRAAAPSQVARARDMAAVSNNVARVCRKLFMW